MNHIETLLSKRWILKQDDRDRYYRVKDNIKELRSLFQEKLGYSLITHQQFIRLDKIPGKAEPWMGINEFQSVLEYQMFCYVLIFLEDLEVDAQFILSSLSEFVQIQLGANEEYWLNYQNRRALVNVLKVCMKEKLIIQDDGNSEYFMRDQAVEALFENTGLSRYFMRNFATNIFEWEKPEDFMKNEWLNENQLDRGIVRKQRVYRTLLLSCGIYQENDGLDNFSYIKPHRKSIQNDFNQLFPCDLQVFNSSAYLILDEEVDVGVKFPKGNALDELVITCCSQIRKSVKNSDYEINEHEIYVEDKERLLNRFKLVIKKQLPYLPSTYRDKKIESLTEAVYNRFIEVGFASEYGGKVAVFPVVAMLHGEFDEEDKA